jgi:hypothetical protein
MKNALIKPALAGIVVLLFSLFSAGASALDTSKTILCASLEVLECVDGADCEAVFPEEVGAPTFMRINVKKKEVKASVERPPSRIDHIEEVEDRLVLQGVEDGRDDERDGAGWTISIHKSTGRMTATVALDQAAIVIFGACTEL